MPTPPSGVLAAIASRIASSLADTCTVQSPTWNATKGIWEPPYVAVATNEPCDVVSIESFHDPNTISVVQQLNIRLDAYRMVTLRKSVLDAHPTIGRDWRIVKGGSTYVIMEAANSDETVPLMAQFHCRKV